MGFVITPSCLSSFVHKPHVSSVLWFLPESNWLNGNTDIISGKAWLTCSKMPLTYLCGTALGQMQLIKCIVMFVVSTVNSYFGSARKGNHIVFTQQGDLIPASPRFTLPTTVEM